MGYGVLITKINRSIDFTATRFFYGSRLFRTFNSKIIIDRQTFFGIDSPSVRLAKLTNICGEIEKYGYLHLQII